ncbi:hypothetical protein D9M68_863460 [compost metagenome]
MVPISTVRKLPMATLMVSLPWAPTWMFSEKPPSNRVLLPKRVVVEMRSSSFFSCTTSSFSALRSLSP